MLRSTASKVMWVGRATVFLVGLAVILALTVGVATSAMGANGQSFLLGRLNAATALTKLTGNVNGAALQVVNPNTGTNDTALSLAVQPGEAPMKVNSAGKVANLNADKLDGMDSTEFLGKSEKAADAAHADTANTAGDADTLDGKSSAQILPLMRSQKDASNDQTYFLSQYSNAQANSVSITAPTDGFLVIWSSMTIINRGGGNIPFWLQTKLDGARTTAEADLHVDHVLESNGENAAMNGTVPVSAGAHTVSVDVRRLSPEGSWAYNNNNLSVMFVPSAQGAVTNTGS